MGVDRPNRLANEKTSVAASNDQSLPEKAMSVCVCVSSSSCLARSAPLKEDDEMGLPSHTSDRRSQRFAGTGQQRHHRGLRVE